MNLEGIEKSAQIKLEIVKLEIQRINIQSKLKLLEYKISVVRELDKILVDALNKIDEKNDD
jgi:hypothetical protein